MQVQVLDQQYQPVRKRNGLLKKKVKDKLPLHFLKLVYGSTILSGNVIQFCNYSSTQTIRTFSEYWCDLPEKLNSLNTICSEML